MSFRTAAEIVNTPEMQRLLDQIAPLTAEERRAFQHCQHEALFVLPPLRRNTRRMLRALDGYQEAWEHRDDWEGLWWDTYERYRHLVEELLAGDTG